MLIVSGHRGGNHLMAIQTGGVVTIQHTASLGWTQAGIFLEQIHGHLARSGDAGCAPLGP
jgi:hypothetical protein